MSEKCHSILPRRNGRLLAHVASVSIDLNHAKSFRTITIPKTN